MNKSPTVLTAIVIPLAGALIAGILAGLLAQAINWPGLAVGLAVALLAWIFRPGALSLPELPAANKEQRVRVDIISEAGHAGDYLRSGY